ncbi:hypothetical protein ATSB10_13880 [Dyella thiooxydans]|uniref:Secreted protein n=1 Tax=Dyella thiooxydans TaxID=445710 RepID=A0A160N154_9GAMM|nr:hypothetical protein [Dyella thiooxydans]AND68842.1 hypothetical protein ATSB10_13880 [Dyella thiooxydans]
MRRPILFSLAAATLSLACSLPSPAFSAGQQGRPVAGSTAGGKTIYGSQLMTPAERNAYRQKMRSLKTAQERQAFRSQHHEEMQKRAQERGMQLPDMPPMGGARGGMGPGMGPGMNKGMGRGMNQGMNQGMGPGMQPMQTQQETRERTRPQTPSSSGKGDPARTQTEQEQRERSTGDDSGGN